MGSGQSMGKLRRTKGTLVGVDAKRLTHLGREDYIKGGWKYRNQQQQL